MIKKPLVVILMGPPGCGKGTQASKLTQILKLPHISTGDILRDNIKKETPLGKETKHIIENGGFPSDDLINPMLFNRVAEKDCREGYILDGYPRTLAQASALEAYLKNTATLKVINFSLKDSTIIERLTGRLTCKHCGQSFHKTLNPPKQLNKCDNCANELTQRKDDSESVVMERLKIYKGQTQPLIDFYKNKQLLEVIPCEGAIEDIFNNTLKLLKN